MPVMLSSGLPTLVSLTVCGRLVVPTVRSTRKGTLAGVRFATGLLPLVPVPVSETVWGLPGALSVMLMAPVRLPVAVGVNVTLRVQFFPGCTALPQLFVWAKSP